MTNVKSMFSTIEVWNGDYKAFFFLDFKPCSNDNTMDLNLYMGHHGKLLGEIFPWMGAP